MRELLSYLWANQFLTVNGNPERGKKLFTAKHCAACHDDPSSGAPDLSKLPRAGQRQHHGLGAMAARSANAGADEPEGDQVAALRSE